MKGSLATVVGAPIALRVLLAARRLMPMHLQGWPGVARGAGVARVGAWWRVRKEHHNQECFLQGALEEA